MKIKGLNRKTPRKNGKEKRIYDERGVEIARDKMKKSIKYNWKNVYDVNEDRRREVWNKGDKTRTCNVYKRKYIPRRCSDSIKNICKRKQWK